MNRREVLKSGATAAAVSPLINAHEHLLSPDVVAKASKAAWKPAVFTLEQNETVVALTDVIIPATDTPGAKAANVNRYIDLLLAEGPEQERDRFLSGLKWFQEYAAKENGTPFAKQPPAKQIAVLEKLNAAEQSSELQDGYRFFRMAKSMTAQIYYQTEIGYKELNKTGAPGSFGCKHANHKA